MCLINIAIIEVQIISIHCMSKRCSYMYIMLSAVIDA